MSEMELHTGRLKFLEENFTKDKLKSFFEKSTALEINDEYKHCIILTQTKFPFNPKFVLFNENLYELVDHEEHEYTDFINKSHKLENGDILFTHLFYNGGCGFSEMLEDSLLQYDESRD